MSRRGLAGVWIDCPVMAAAARRRLAQQDPGCGVIVTWLRVVSLERCRVVDVAADAGDDGAASPAEDFAYFAPELRLAGPVAPVAPARVAGAVELMVWTAAAIDGELRATRRDADRRHQSGSSSASRVLSRSCTSATSADARSMPSAVQAIGFSVPS